MQHAGLTLAVVVLVATAASCEKTQAVQQASTTSTPSATPSATPPAPAASSLSARGSSVPPEKKSVRAWRDAGREITWKYSGHAVGPMEVVVTIPERAKGGPKLPVLVALHGRGEAHKGAHLGARGWVDDYGLNRALERLTSPPLTKRDFQGFVSTERLSSINRDLRKRPFRGVIVVSPYTPDILAGEKRFDDALPFAKFLVEELLPRVYKETPAIGTPAATGIDGVSLGGRMSLLVGLARPKAFGTVGVLQPAFKPDDTAELVRRAKAAVTKNERLRFRFLSSEEDFFLAATKRIGAAFKAAGLRTETLIARGTHSYKFNRGPGVIEMLLLHDRTLRSSD